MGFFLRDQHYVLINGFYPRCNNRPYYYFIIIIFRSTKIVMPLISSQKALVSVH